MKKILLSIAGACVLANPSALLAQTCTAGQLDVNYGPNGSNGYVQISPMTFPASGGASYEDEAFDSSNASYSFVGTALDNVGNLIAGVTRLKAGGARDGTFGGFGSVVLPSSPSAQTFNAMTVDSQGRLVVAVLDSNGNTLTFTRFLSAGIPDLTYGTSGAVTITLPGQAFAPLAISAAADGSVVYAMGFNNNTLPPGFRIQPAVLRITPAGALDTTFGTNGYSFFYPSTGKATDVRALANGTIVVGGRFTDSQTYSRYFVARLLANGSLDPSFGAGTGIATADFGGAYAVGRKLAIQSNGRIVLGGEVLDTATSAITDVGLIRLKTDGSLDSSFSGGTVRLPLNVSGGIGVNMQNNDKILLAVQQFTDASQTALVTAIARVTTSGQLDPAFGSGGESVIAPPPGYPQVSAYGFGYSGKIIVHLGGYDPATNLSAEYLVRLDDGTGAGCH